MFNRFKTPRFGLKRTAYSDGFAKIFGKRVPKK